MKHLSKNSYFLRTLGYLQGKLVQNLLKLIILTSSIWLCLGGLLLIIDAFAM